jgi:hypothetical protein
MPHRPMQQGASGFGAAKLSGIDAGPPDMLWSPTVRPHWSPGRMARRLLPRLWHEPSDRPTDSRSPPRSRHAGARAALLLVSRGGGADAEAPRALRLSVRSASDKPLMTNDRKDHVAHASRLGAVSDHAVGKIVFAYELRGACARLGQLFAGSADIQRGFLRQ